LWFLRFLILAPSLSSQSVLSFHSQRAAHQVRLPGGCSGPSHFSCIPLGDFPASAYCVAQLLHTCFEFSHRCVHPFVISATAFWMLVISEGALSQLLPHLVKAQFSFPHQDLAVESIFVTGSI
jgi:hypothetical protein